MAATLRRCLYCGGAPIEAERPRERHLVCPGCKGSMTEVAVGSLMIDQCGACGGVWYDRGELEQAIAIEKAKAAQDLWEHLPGGDPKRDAKAIYRSCPICRQAMLRKLKGPVVIDLCGAHGAFLDAGELEAIAQHKDAAQPEPKKKERVARGPEVLSNDEEYVDVFAGAVVVDLAADVIASVFFDW